jgi:hypothetical protein
MPVALYNLRTVRVRSLSLGARVRDKLVPFAHLRDLGVQPTERNRTLPPLRFLGSLLLDCGCLAFRLSQALRGLFLCSPIRVL